ncbi:Uncharacterised protein [Klebsiella pneumoniae]|nr:Uncharacterised protein [Klebsiella pneumoniae]
MKWIYSFSFILLNMQLIIKQSCVLNTAHTLKLQNILMQLFLVVLVNQISKPKMVTLSR